MAERIFLTGATGFIGSHVMRRLLEQGREVVVLSRRGRDHAHLRDVSSPKLEVVTGDLLEPETYREALAGCTAVIHIAGVISTLRADRDRMWTLNHTVTRNLWDACLQARPSRVLYLGSIFALGRGRGDEPVDETVVYDEGIQAAGVPYMQAKRAAELMTWEYLERGLPVTFGYPGFCIGPGDYYLSSMRVVSLYLRRRIPFYVDGGINFIDVRDAAAGLILNLDRGEVGRKYIIGAYNLRWSDLFARLEAATGVPAPRRRLSYGAGIKLGRIAETMRLGRLLSSGDIVLAGNTWWYDASRARVELGLELRPLEESLRDGVAWLREHQL